MSEVGSYADFVIQTRPEIRKGCVWDIGLLFSLDALTKYKLKEIYLEKPRVQRESGAYLCLKVRSKLIQKEIGFGKVGELEPNGPFIEPNISTGCATLKVKFMQRPRAVFHRHADVMVLVVSIRSCSTNEVLMTAEHELIFRGGTGSMHSAERKKATVPLPTSSSYHHDLSHASHHSESSSHASHHGSHHASHHGNFPSAHHALSHATRLPRSSRSASPSPSLLSFTKPSREHFAISEAVTRAHPQAASLFPSATNHLSLGGLPNSSNPPSSSDDSSLHNPFFLQNSGSFLLDSMPGDNDENAPHMVVQPLTLANIQEFQQGLQAHCQHAKSSSLLPQSSHNTLKDQFEFPSSLSPTTGLTEDSSNTDLDDALELEAWAKSSGLDTGLFDSPTDAPTLDLNSMPYATSSFPPLATDASFFPPESNYALAPPSLNVTSSSHPFVPKHDTDPISLSSDHDQNTEVGGTTGAVTRARSAKMNHATAQKKRRAGFEPEFMPNAKMSRSHGDSLMADLSEVLNPPAGNGFGSFEDKVFQKLFFRSLCFLSLEELRALAQTAPLPIFVKDEQGAYMLANPAFCSFVYDETWESIANRSAEQLLEADESERINKADEYCMEREGNIGTFYLSVKHQDYRVMKLYTKLRDCDQKVVVCAVTF